MYIPNKPAKYGLKIVMLCDVNTKYILNAIPYLGNESSTEVKGMMLGHYFTKKLSEPYFNSGRNVTVDNWFTSVPLANDMLDNGLTIVGTIRSNKPDIPFEMLKTSECKPGITAFCLENKLTLLSYRPTSKKKMVLVLSSMHN